MSNSLSTLEPKALWENFSALNAVPRPSKKEERVIAFMVDFGKSLGLPTYQDEVGNVIIKKPASAGMENRQTIVLQSHLDMVHQKNADTKFDFDTQGIDMFIEGDWVKAKGTTLGADNGIGVASIMTLLATTTIPHPAIEALFTIDEETGMTGAMGLKGGLLDGKILLNLDTEDDHELTIGCAGGIDVTGTRHYIKKPVAEESLGLEIILRGLTGGHSGMDIHLGRGNANKLMNRLLLETHKTVHFEVASIDGGGLRNAIPRESHVHLAVTSEHKNLLVQTVKEIENTFKAEFRLTDPNLEVVINEIACPENVFEKHFQEHVFQVIHVLPNGIFRMTPGIEGLVQSSNNVARVLIKNGDLSIQCLTRSSVDSEKMDLANSIDSAFHLLGAHTEMKGSYPGWMPQPDAAIVTLMSDLYQEVFGSAAMVNACHAGLECGILGTNYPGMQMISFGPNIRGAHSPDERVQISSVQKYWSFLLKTLERIPTN
ncbi:MAG: aminoacyl-histidine dipeptidase [Bacteroidia bacterium]|nr:aminoacyl-histidine dipeptidase [Bacteroidia bacterium]MCF8446718.1 aminoacyl-histidine dipeptidase [Bacteroidia bacterium]